MAYAVPTLVEARAIQALKEGKATGEQQKAALNYVFVGCCRAGLEDLIPGQPDTSAYLQGRKSVMLQIGWVLGQPAESFRKKGETD